MPIFFPRCPLSSLIPEFPGRRALPFAAGVLQAPGTRGEMVLAGAAHDPPPAGLRAPGGSAPLCGERHLFPVGRPAACVFLTGVPLVFYSRYLVFAQSLHTAPQLALSSTQRGRKGPCLQPPPQGVLPPGQRPQASPQGPSGGDRRPPHEGAEPPAVLPPPRPESPPPPGGTRSKPWWPGKVSHRHSA